MDKYNITVTLHYEEHYEVVTFTKKFYDQDLPNAVAWFISERELDITPDQVEVTEGENLPDWLKE